MSYFKIKKDLEKRVIYPSYFFYGQESFLAEEIINEIKEILIPEGKEDFIFTKFELDENKWDDVIAEAKTIPFLFSEKKLILVEIKDRKSENLTPSDENLLKEYFSSPSSQTVLIIKTINPDKRKSLYKFFASLPLEICCRVEFTPLRGRQLFTWIDNRIKAKGKFMGLNEKQRLVEIVGNDLRNLNNEVEKLVTYTGDRKNIQLEDIEEVTGYIRSFALWELTDCLERFDLKGSLKIINQLFNEGYHPLAVLSLLSRFFENLLSVKIMIKENFSSEEIANQILIPYFKIQNFISLSKKFTQEELNFFISNLKEIDFKCKSTPVDAKILLENFLYSYWKKKSESKFI